LVALLASQAAGCIIVSGEEDVASIEISWRLTQAGATLPCPPTITTAALYAHPVDSSGRRLSGEPYIDLYDCNDGVGLIADLPPDEYQVWMELTTEGGGTVHARSPRWPDGMLSVDRNDIVNVISSDKDVSIELLQDGGYFALSWDLVDSVNTSQALTCADALADGVGVVATASGSSTFTDDKFNCEAGFGITAGLRQGTYTLAVDAFEDGPSGGAIGPTTTLTNQTIRPRNDVNDIGHVQVRID
jgi:hypothetical protein